jgi:hypothetical protein
VLLVMNDLVGIHCKIPFTFTECTVCVLLIILAGVNNPCWCMNDNCLFLVNGGALRKYHGSLQTVCVNRDISILFPGRRWEHRQIWFESALLLSSPITIANAVTRSPLAKKSETTESNLPRITGFDSLMQLWCF